MKFLVRFHLVLVAVLCLSVAVAWQRTVKAQTSCSVPPAGLFAWYPGDGNANDIQNSYHGALQNGATFTVGKVGQAFSLDGVDDYVRIATNGNFGMGTGDGTYEAWVKLAGPISGATVYTDGYNGNSVSSLFIQNNVAAFVARDGNGNGATATGTTALNDGAWHHLAGVRQGTTVRIYVDGVQQNVATNAALGPVNDFCNFAFIGGVNTNVFCASNATEAFFKGLIDEVQVFRRALTPQEILNTYNADSAGTCKPTNACTSPPSNLLVWLPGDNNGLDIQSGNVGALQNGATFAPGKVGQAFRLDGVDDRVEIPDSPSVSPTGALSIDAWIRLDQLANRAQTIVAKYDYASQDQQSQQELSYNFSTNGGGKLTFAVFQSRPNHPNDGRFLDTKFEVLQAGVFAHVAATFSPPSTMKIYVNGVAVPDQDANVSGDPVPQIHDSSHPVYLGVVRGVNQFENIFGGLLDEVHLYNRELSAAEIQAIYNTGSAGVCRSCTAPPAGLVGWYPGDGNAFDIQNGNNGTLQNGATFDVGKVGQAFSLDGVNDHVRISNSPGLNFTTAMTVDAWIMPTAFRRFAAIVEKWDAISNLNQRSYLLDLDENGHLEFRVSPDGVGSFDHTGNVLSTASVPLNAWSHVTGVYDGATLKVYINSELQGQTTYNMGIFVGSDDVGIGAGVGGVPTGQATDLFAGLIDEVHIYNRALSQADIQNIYNASNAGMCKSAANDNFVNAQVINGGSGTVTGVNFDATREAGEPNHAGVPGGTSVWYRWQAPTSGPAFFTTAGSTFDTLLAAYTGTSVSSLATIASNDDNTGDRIVSNPLTSSISFNAIAGTTYYIAVDGARGQKGSITLAWFYEASIGGHTSLFPGLGTYDVLVQLSGDDTRAVRIVNGNGSYNFTHLRVGGNYHLEAHLSSDDSGNNTFVPRDYAPLTGNVTNADFTDTGARGGGASTFTARVETPTSAGVPGVTVNLSGGAARTTTTDNDGFFIFTNLPNGSYTITPVSDAYIFEPASINFSGNLDNLGAIIVARTAYLIRGQVRDGSGNALSGAILTLGGAQASTSQSDAGGNYAFTGLRAGQTYTVTAAKQGVSFIQPTLTFANLSANQKTADFTTPATLQISTVSPPAGRATGGQQLNLTGAFAGLSTVTMGGTAATWSYTNGASDTTHITITTPAHTVGAVQIDLMSTSGSAYTKQNAFAYLPTVFTDNTLTSGVTTAKAQHITELRQAVDALRVVAGLQPAPWTDPVLTPFASAIRAVHIIELRAYLDDVTSRLGYAAGLPYTDPGLGAGTMIKRIHIEELRQRIRTIAG